MARHLGLSLVLGLAALATAGCTTSRMERRLAPPAEGFLLGVGVTAASGAFAETALPAGQKQGRASSQSFLDLVAVGQAGAAQAAKAGGVNRIQSADVEVIRVKALSIPLYTRYTVVVRGD